MGRRAWDSTAVTGDGPGRYRAHVGEEWVLAMVPQGGVLAAVAARAMAAELDTHLPLRSLHVVFASPVPAGEVVIEATALRRGRSVSQASATVTGPGADSGLSALGVFGGDQLVELKVPGWPRHIRVDAVWSTRRALGPAGAWLLESLTQP